MKKVLLVYVLGALFTSQGFSSSKATMDIEWPDEVSIYTPDYRSIRVFSMTFSEPTVQKEPDVVSRAVGVVANHFPDYVLARGNAKAVRQFYEALAKLKYETQMFNTTAHQGSDPFWAQAVWRSGAQKESEEELERRHVWCERTLTCQRSVLPSFLYHLASLGNNPEKLKVEAQLEEISDSPCMVHVGPSRRDCLVSVSGFDLGAKTLYSEAAARNLMYWVREKITENRHYQKSADFIFMGRFNHVQEQLGQIDMKQLVHYSNLIHLGDEASEPLRRECLSLFLGWDYDDVFASPTFDDVRVTLYPISTAGCLIDENKGNLKELKAMGSSTHISLIHQPVIATFVYDFKKPESPW